MSQDDEETVAFDIKTVVAKAKEFSDRYSTERPDTLVPIHPDWLAKLRGDWERAYPIIASYGVVPREGGEVELTMLKTRERSPRDSFRLPEPERFVASRGFCVGCKKWFVLESGPSCLGFDRCSEHEGLVPLELDP